MKPLSRRTLSCSCGAVKIELIGSPIMVNICHCDDCQKGALRIENLTTGLKILDQYGGTPYVLYRKDRVKFIQGQELLDEIRIEGEKDTRRVVTSCCKSPFFLDFEPGHWFSIFQQRFDNPIPRAQRRIQTRFMARGVNPDDGLPRYKEIFSYHDLQTAYLPNRNGKNEKDEGMIRPLQRNTMELKHSEIGLDS